MAHPISPVEGECHPMASPPANSPSLNGRLCLTLPFFLYLLLALYILYICDCVCINQPFSTKVEFSAGAKVVNTLPFYAYISKSENPNNFTVESQKKKLKTSAYSVYKSLFNGVLISEFIKCAICLVYANMVTYYYYKNKIKKSHQLAVRMRIIRIIVPRISHAYG